jgi:hypothetical protein
MVRHEGLSHGCLRAKEPEPSSSERGGKMKRKLLLGVLVLTLVGTASWAKNFPLTAGKITPAAAGKVDVGKDKNGNIQITIKTEHLAKPSTLTPPAAGYVVWFQERGSEPINQGQLKVRKNLKGKFKTTTRYQNFDVFVTAEPDPATKIPSEQVVLRAKVRV